MKRTKFGLERLKLTENWKEVAWNGVRFKTPAEWEMAQIGYRHLLLENDAGPVMEVKWGPVKGKFSHKTHLKRLAALHSRQVKDRISEWRLPSHWEAALTGFETSGFLWQGEAAIGRGSILFCPICRNAALIQFFRYKSAPSEKVLSAILRSYRDHSRNNRILWSIFDIRMTLPHKLKLIKFRFEAGKFLLGFIHGRQKIYLHRWAPATAILMGGDLVGFTRAIPEFSIGEPRTLTIDGYEAVEWSIMPESDWQRRISRLKVNSSYFWYRLWHVEEKNRILGIRAESKYPLDSPLLDQIYADYETV